MADIEIRVGGAEPQTVTMTAEESSEAVSVDATGSGTQEISVQAVSSGVHTLSLSAAAEADDIGADILTASEQADRARQFALDAEQAAQNAEEHALRTRTAVNNINNNVGELEDEVIRNRTRITALETAGGEHVASGDVEDGVAYFYNDSGEVLFEITGIGGGGGGGGSDTGTTTVTLSNRTGWASTTVAENTDVVLSLEWSSEDSDGDTGDGTLTLTVNGVTRETRNLVQGAFTVNTRPYLTRGVNRVVVEVTDSYGKSRHKNFTVDVQQLLLTSSFDDSTVQSGVLEFPFTPYGAFSKTVHFELDGTELEPVVTSSSGRQMSNIIRQQSHGAHTLRVWFTAVINGVTVPSNELFYDIIWTTLGNNTPIISSSYSGESVSQYSSVTIPFMVYTPNSVVSNVTVKLDGTTVSTLRDVGREMNSISLRMNTVGQHTVTLQSGTAQKQVTLTVTEAAINVEAETEGLQLYLSSSGRSNLEEHPETWSYGEAGSQIASTLTGFNFVNNGWVRDEDDVTVLRVNGGARVNIPFQIFQSDFRATGKTIEIEFAVRDVQNYASSMITCYSGGRGIQITPQRATLRSEQSEITMQYKDEEHVRLTFVCEKSSENRLLMAYIDSVPSAVVQYASSDDFSQASPVGITIGSDDCTTDIYCIRVYGNDLNRTQVMNNWIADTQNGAEMLARFGRNNVFDEYGDIVIEKLPSDLPYMVIQCAELPQYKGDKKTCAGYYVDPMNPNRSFTFEGCQINVQGTSSAKYERKNYDMQYKGGFTMRNGTVEENYEMADNIVPFNRYVVKADVASSEGANNVELVKLYCELTPFKSREAVADPRVRAGIYGFPIVIFWTNTDTGETIFLGKYNFNLPKRAPEPYGYSGDMQSWEFQNNTSNLMLFKTDYFDETMRTDPETGEAKEAWRYDYEARFPDDSFVDYSALQELQSFVVSTDRSKATGDALSASVTYEGVTYTTDTADYRLAKFRNEFPTYAERDSFIFYYIFTEFFLMVDSRAKNLFIGFNGGDVTEAGRVATRKATAEPYDMDTALGINNEGSLAFGYNLEDTDHLQGGDPIFNGQESVLWNNVRDAYPVEIQQMYQSLRTNGSFSYAAIERKFEEHQTKWPEAVWIEDSWFKYILPLTSPDPGKEATDAYLDMMQGNKLQQRKWWLANRFKYMDSKWMAGDALSEVIQFRAYETASVSVTPYADMYVTVKYGSYTGSERATQGVPVTISVPVDSLSDTEIYVHGASQIADVGDLSPFRVGWADFSHATRIQRIKIGDAASGYQNNRCVRLTLGNNRLLKVVDMRNCVALGTGPQKNIDMSGCVSLEEAYFDGTSITGLLLPNGGRMKKLHLPGTVANLTIRNHSELSEFVCPDYSSITTLWLENPSGAIDTMAIVSAMSSGGRVRLYNFHWEMEDLADVSAMFDKLDSMRGLDQNGNNTDRAQVYGSIHVDYAQAYIYNDIINRYPDVTITYDEMSPSIIYKSEDGQRILYIEALETGGNGTRLLPDAKEQTAQYTYTPAGWSLEIGGNVDPNALNNVESDRIVFAVYTAVLRQYSITWVRGAEDGNDTLRTDSVAYGQTPSYGSAPSSTRGSTFAFIEWEPAVAAVTGDQTYTAVFKAPVTITYKDYDGTVLGTESVRYGWNAANAPTPSRASTAQYTYAFDGWSDTAGGTAQSGILTGVTADKDVFAVYTTTLRNYTITFVKASEDGGGTLQTGQVPYGQLPEYTGVTPATTKQDGEYQFNGWSPALAAVTGDQTYTAVFRDVSSPVVQYLSGTLVDYDNDEDTKLDSTAFYYMTTLKTVKSAATTFEAGAFTGCSSLEKVDLTGNVSSIPSSVFSGHNKLDALILRANQVVPLSDANALNGTKIARRLGAIYVPSNLVSAYKAATNWSNFVIASIDQYPLTEFSSIADSWDTIISYANAGTIGDHYAIGDTKKVTIGGVDYYAQLVGINKDTLSSDGTSKANSTWMLWTVLSNANGSTAKARMNATSTTVGGWADTEMRNTTLPSILQTFPANLQSAIKTVNKVSYRYEDTSEQVTADKLWIPSAQEVSNTNNIKETTGVSYDEVFTGASASRTKYNNNVSAESWWTRSASSSNNYAIVANNGAGSSAPATSETAVLIGFCI